MQIVLEPQQTLLAQPCNDRHAQRAAQRLARSHRRLAGRRRRLVSRRRRTTTAAAGRLTV